MKPSQCAVRAVISLFLVLWIGPALSAPTAPARVELPGSRRTTGEAAKEAELVVRGSIVEDRPLDPTSPGADYHLAVLVPVEVLKGKTGAPRVSVIYCVALGKETEPIPDATYFFFTKPAALGRDEVLKILDVTKETTDAVKKAIAETEASSRPSQ